MKKHCSIEGCEKAPKKRGWCDMHYARWWRHGSAESPGPGGEHFGSPAESFSARVAEDGRCLIWTGVKTGSGYGQIYAHGRFEHAHRYSWEQAHGPIPDGMFIDHKCYRRDCVKLDHLRLATVAENAANRSGAQANSSTGVRNVYRVGGRFKVSIQKGGVARHVGCYDTVEEASVVAEAERERAFGKFAGRG